jgi:CyaY protein
MSANTPMQETEFHLVVDSLLLRLQIRLDELPTNVDSELSSGILTLTFENGSKIIINRQTPNREIWVAAKSGGFHFRFVSTDWIDTRSGQSLGCLLTKVISQQSGTEFPIILN